MMDLQIFQQFIDERLEMLNTGLGFSDEFELETVRYAEKIKKRGRNYAFLKNVKDKTNPAVKSAVKSVKEGSRGVKTAYKDLRSKFRDTTPPNGTSTHFHSHLSSSSQHDRIDGYVGGSKTIGGHHSAPNSPVFNKRGVVVADASGGYQYASPEALNGVSQYVRRTAAQPLVSHSSTHLQPNGHASGAHRLAVSPTVSPASSLCSSEMNLSQELQNHPLFKSPAVDRSLKPSSSLDPNHRISATRSGGPPPTRPPPPAAHLLHMSSTAAYYNHPYAPQRLRQPQQSLPHQHPCTHSSIAETQPSSVLSRTQTHSAHKHATAPDKIIITESIYDCPPDMQPPVPPRRQGNNSGSGAAATAVAIQRFQRNYWQDYAERSLPHNNNVLRGSSSSNTSSASSSGSNASFVSAASAISQQRLHEEATGLVPVPTPRLKRDKEKESLRSLQPQYLQSSHPPSSLHSAPSTSSQEDTMNDLISLNDSNNASFDLDDFDPLNQNARLLPLSGIGGGVRNRRATTLPASTSTTSSVSNPLYPYFNKLQPPTVKAPPLPTSVPPQMPPPDEDFELLRKYGLDQFTLTNAGPTATTNVTSTNHSNGAAVATGMSNWTTFD